MPIECNQKAPFLQNNILSTCIFDTQKCFVKSGATDLSNSIIGIPVSIRERGRSISTLSGVYMFLN